MRCLFQVSLEKILAFDDENLGFRGGHEFLNRWIMYVLKLLGRNIGMQVPGIVSRDFIRRNA